MSTCRHQQLNLMSAGGPRLRCRRCHLTIKADELAGGCCPECYERTGQWHQDFEAFPGEMNTCYRCEVCGIIIQCRDPEI